MARYLAEFIQFLIHTACNDIALSKLRRRLWMHGLSKIVQQFGAVSHPVDEHIHSLDPSSLAELHYRADLTKSPAQLHYLARHDLACSSTRNDSFKVSDIAYHCLKAHQVVTVFCEILYDRISFFQFLQIHHRHCKPGSEHSSAHRRGASVHYIDQRCSFLSCCGSEDFKVSEGESVHPYERTLVDAGYRTDIGQFLMLSLLQIYEQCSGRSDTEREVIDCKSLEGINPELSLEFFH